MAIAYQSLGLLLCVASASVCLVHFYENNLVVVPRSSWLRSPEPRRFSSSSSSVVAPPLVIQNVPTHLAWKKGEKNPRTTEKIKVMPVDFGYYFNPSILELDNGKHIFALRMGWVYRSGCEKFHVTAADEAFSSELMVEAMFLCLKHHKERFVDQTLFGEFDPPSQTLVVRNQGRAPSSLLTSKKDFDSALWDAGAFWHDTRLVYPWNERPIPGLNKIFLTSQSIEILGHDDWNALDGDSNLCLHVTHLAAIDPLQVLKPDVMNRQKMTRWLYYDAEQDRQEWNRRKQGESKWQLSSFDIARLKCQQRPAGLPSLPFDPNEMSMNSLSNQDRLDESWYFLKDKNWSPFAYNGTVLWSYTIAPNHVVCENDIDLRQEGADGADCVLCVTKYNSSSSSVFDALNHRLHLQGYENVAAHLNGAPAYLVPGKNLYLGLMHIIKVNRTSDELGWEKRSRTYEHYFYVLEAVPPFRVVGVSTLRVVLERSRGWSHWFDIDDVVTVEFAMYMQFHPDRPGREIVISYGDGDRMSRTATLAIDDIWNTLDTVAATDGP
jgi:hypothetical protein